MVREYLHPAQGLAGGQDLGDLAQVVSPPRPGAGHCGESLSRRDAGLYSPPAVGTSPELAAEPKARLHLSATIPSSQQRRADPELGQKRCQPADGMDEKARGIGFFCAPKHPVETLDASLSD